MRLKTYGDRDEMPTEWEQDVANIYVNYKVLVRPNTNIKVALVFFLIFVLATSLFSWFFNSVLSSIEFIKFIPYSVSKFNNEHKILSFFIIYMIVIFIELFISFKYILIGIIKLYQHYAPEEIRRRCLFMPTCSEYAIMAIQKYGSVIGLYKSYFRLFYRCKGNIYQIDYP